MGCKARTQDYVLLFFVAGIWSRSKLWCWVNEQLGRFCNNNRNHQSQFCWIPGILSFPDFQAVGEIRNVWFQRCWPFYKMRPCVEILLIESLDCDWLMSEMFFLPNNPEGIGKPSHLLIFQMLADEIVQFVLFQTVMFFHPRAYGTLIAYFQGGVLHDNWCSADPMNYKQGMFGKDHAFRDLLYPILLANSKGNSLAISNTYSGWSTSLKFHQRFNKKLHWHVDFEQDSGRKRHSYLRDPEKSTHTASNLIRETFRRRLVPVKRVANGNEARWSPVWMSWRMGGNPVT